MTSCWASDLIAARRVGGRWQLDGKVAPNVVARDGEPGDGILAQYGIELRHY